MVVKLKWNWKKVFKARGIDDPVKFMVKLKISRGVASRIANNEADMISLKNLEKLCRALNCTPDDALEFEPTGAEVEKDSLALLTLKKGRRVQDAATLLRGISYKKLREIAKVLREGED